MRLFDTSTLVAAHLTGHPAYEWASEQIEQGDVALCGHSLAELYAVLTSHPHYRIPPAQAQFVLEAIEQNWQVFSLTSSDYLAATDRCRRLGLTGGAIYDTLIAQAALGMNASALVTLNPKHFLRLGEDVARLVITRPT